MKLEKTGETSKTVVFQSDCIREDIDKAVQILISNSVKDPFYFFKNPTYLFKFIHYAGVRIRKEHIFIPRSITTPPMYMEFENIPTEVTFRVSYFPVMRWAFFGAVPLIAYSLYRSIENETSNKVILSIIGVGVVMCSFFALLAYIEKKWNNYFFKRDVKRIVRDIVTPRHAP